MTTLSLSQFENEHFRISNEFSDLDFNDGRLSKRIIKIAETFSHDPTASIPKACGTWPATKATYDFFKNEKVDEHQMLIRHKEMTAARVAKHKVVLSVQDTSSFNYTSHPQTKGLGTIGTKQDTTFGIMMHDTMAFTTEGLALGLLDLQTWTRPPEEFGKKKTRSQRPIEDKESYKWLKSFEATQALQEKVPETTLVSIGDREADIYELFDLATKDENGPELLVRAEHNRELDETVGYLLDFIASQTVAGTYDIVVPRKNKKPKRKATLDVRFAKVTIMRPQNKKRRDQPLAESVTLWAILAEEKNPPRGVEPISWLLLTTMPIETFEDAIEKIQWYMIRWQIELFHKILKSGCRVEERQLTSAEQLIHCLMVDAVVAWRILLLTKLGREVPDLPCSVVFEEYEWKALHCFVKQTQSLPDKEPTLQQAIRMVAKLGGFLARKHDGEPGSMTIWKGLQRLTDIAATWQIMSIPLSEPRLMGKG